MPIRITELAIEKSAAAIASDSHRTRFFQPRARSHFPLEKCSFDCAGILVDCLLRFQHKTQQMN
ncbi:MAG: hypothetical protein MUE44_29175 [Oscillatoriaceae cyanobacterium Prado104]|nr:hypothetical protein [Oscillatoriaceae cyanobacterium Prado104]